MTDQNPTIQRTIDRFDDIFHRYGDDNDDEDENIRTQFANSISLFDSDDENNHNDYNMFIDTIDDSIAVSEQQEHLSQTLSLLSMFAEDQEDNEKPMEEIELIPKYLTKNYKAFDEMISSLIRKSSTLINIESLRDIAFLIHQIESVKLDRLLWTIYLQSGTGELKLKRTMRTGNSNLKKIFFCPEEVKQKMFTHGHTSATDPNGNLDHDPCIVFVNRILENFQNQLLDYQSKLEQMKQEKFKYILTNEIEQGIEKFIQQYGMSIYKIPIESLISIVEYDYKDRLIEFEFENENPNEFQKEIFNNIFKVKSQKEISKFEAAILKQRLAHNHLPKAFQSLDIPSPLSLKTIQDDNIRQHLQDRAEKVLQRTKCHMILVYLAVAETKMNEYRINYDKLMSELQLNQKSGSIHQKLNEKMFNLMEERFKNINEHLIRLYRLKICFFRQCSNGQELDLVHRWSIITENKSNLTCSPSLIQHTNRYHLTDEQRNFLNRGPTYVPPCQIHILSKSSLTTLAEILTKKMAPLRRDLTALFTKYPVDLSRRINFEKEIQQLFHESFLQPIPRALEERALYEQQLLKSIKYQLEKNHLILRRTANHQNMYYLGQIDEFQQKTMDYMQHSTATYEFIGTIDDFNSEQFYLEKILQSIDSDLKSLLQRKLISKDLQIKFIIKQSTKSQLPNLDFLPDLNQNDSIIVQPRLSSFQWSPIALIANYLEQLVKPYFENCSQSTIFLDENDFIKKLDYYCIQQGLLQRTTYFVTFKILNLSTDLKHSTLLRTLNQFLINRSMTGRYGKLSSETIEELTALILRNLFFIYKNKIYRYIKGYPLNLSYLELLMNIYLYDWQLTLVREFRLRDLFYGRCQQSGFFTWRESLDLLPVLFEKVQKSFDSNIKLITCTGSNVQFLEISIENRQGSLYTRISHDQHSRQQPFLLPYTKDHPRLFHRQWFQWSLIRAGLLCSSFEDFEEERRYIEATFLVNGYSLDFVEYHLREFYAKFYPIQQQQQQKQIILTKLTFPRLRRELFRFIEQGKIQLANKLQLKRTHKLIHLHYLFDWGSRCQFSRKFYELWSSMIEQDPQFKKYAIKIQLQTKHCYSSNTFLAQSI
ncbi:unnamed protein product [Rotaria socialis]|uniref:Helix-turn-helix domain-containing protein n=3 Tax=Rotaria socialis TaxID=392032 RepID=A0A818CM77_9BILA|nr:unnamed protein product [Rotaria socialis]